MGGWLLGDEAPRALSSVRLRNQAPSLKGGRLGGRGTAPTVLRKHHGRAHVWHRLWHPQPGCLAADLRTNATPLASAPLMLRPM